MSKLYSDISTAHRKLSEFCAAPCTFLLKDIGLISMYEDHIQKHKQGQEKALWPQEVQVKEERKINKGR